MESINFNGHLFLTQIDDQICLLINSWCELLLFSCCFRSISTPGEVRISLGKSINLEQAKSSGLQVNILEFHHRKMATFILIYFTSFELGMH